MKTKIEAVMDILEREREYALLIEQYGEDEELLGEADYLFQQGVRATEIALLLESPEYSLSY
jgi:hypothetical protein